MAQAARQCTRVLSTMSLRPTVSRRAYVPMLQTQEPVASTSSQPFGGPEAPVRQERRPKEAATNRSKGKERAVEPSAAEEAAASESSGGEGVSTGSAAEQNESLVSREPVGFGTSEIEWPAARYPEPDPLPFSTGPSLALGVLKHPFNTHAFVEQLVSAGVPRDRAEVLMDAARSLALREMDRAEDALVSRVAAENDAFLYSAALSELRTEIQVDVREETLAQRSANARIHRRIESLSQTTSEQVEGLKSEIKYEFQHSRDETNADFKNLELRIAGVNNSILLMFGRERAELESLKWILLRNIFLAVASFAIFSVLVNEAVRERPALPTLESFGVKPLEEPSDLPSPVVAQRRVGEEEESGVY